MYNNLRVGLHGAGKKVPNSLWFIVPRATTACGCMSTFWFDALSVLLPSCRRWPATARSLPPPCGASARTRSPATARSLSAPFRAPARTCAPAAARWVEDNGYVRPCHALPPCKRGGQRPCDVHAKQSRGRAPPYGALRELRLVHLVHHPAQATRPRLRRQVRTGPDRLPL